MRSQTTEPVLALAGHRRGPRPKTTDSNPHSQLDQNAPLELQDAVHRAVVSLRHVTTGRSDISLPGSRAYHLASADGPREPLDGFMLRREFAHLHPADDGSTHTTLPPWIVGQVLKNGWGELHPVAGLYGMPLNTVMLYGPRDDEELRVVLQLLGLAHGFASGRFAPPTSAFVVDMAHVA